MKTLNGLGKQRAEVERGEGGRENGCPLLLFFTTKHAPFLFVLLTATSHSHCLHALTLVLLCQDHLLLRSAMSELLGDVSHFLGSTLLPPLTLWAPKPPALAVLYECLSLIHEATKPLRVGLRSQSHLLGWGRPPHLKHRKHTPQNNAG